MSADYLKDRQIVKERGFLALNCYVREDNKTTQIKLWDEKIKDEVQFG